MIDTIVLRIHDTLRYSHLIKHLDSANLKGFSTETARIEQGEINDLKRMGVKRPSEIIDMLRINRSGEFLVKSKVAKQVGSSGHYSFAYHVNYTANFIEFNFSIPKYLFGSNVLQFVDHFGDKYYSYSDCVHLEYNIERAFDRLSGFLHYFFKIEFPFDDLDYKDIEVHRIDVCFNQVFSSKGEALRYLEYQKRLKKKYTRDEEGGTYREYASSLMYITKRYSAKIYHKGTEYTRNDLKEHLRYNKEKRKLYFDTQRYQEFADRILRYELTLRTDMLNYMHKRGIFRKKCPHFQSYFKRYREVENWKQRNDRIAKMIGSLPEDEREAYRKEHPYKKIEKEDNNLHKYITKLISKRTHFTLEVAPEIAEYNRRTIEVDCNKALFSGGLLKLCLKKLVGFMGEFEIKELPDEQKVEQLVNAYNREHRVPLPTSEMVWFYKQLKEIGSFKETAKFYNLSRATLYRYRERFKKVGITENNIRPLTEDGVTPGILDFSNYHYEVTYTPNFLKANSILQ